MKETCYIYGLRSKDATEFFYVGSTKRELGWRLGKHKNHCVSGLHRNPEFTRVVKEIGVDNIVIDLIEEVNQDERFQRERYWINTLPNLVNVVKKPDGYKRQPTEPGGDWSVNRKLRIVKKPNDTTSQAQDGDGLRLTLKQRKFCLAFIGEANGNGVEAARSAGYRGDDPSLRVIASQNLTKLNIQQYINQLRADAERAATGKILSATEVLVGLTRIAEADIAEVFELDGSFDLASARKRGKTRLIKTMSFDKDTGKLTKLELHNAHGAHVDLGKYHKLFTDRIEIVKPTEAARSALETILSETGMSEEKARQIVASRFGISEQELISESVN